MQPLENGVTHDLLLAAAALPDESDRFERLPDTLRSQLLPFQVFTQLPLLRLPPRCGLCCST